MAIKRNSKIETSFGSASMTDLMFLLLIFLLVATTLINTNALKILLPQSSNQISEKTETVISVTADLKYFVDKVEVPFDNMEEMLKHKLNGVEKPIIMLNMDKRVSVEEFTKVMNIAQRNNYSLLLMTQP